MTVDVVLEDLVGRRIPYRGILHAERIVLGLPNFGAFVFIRTNDLTPDMRRVYRQAEPVLSVEAKI